MFRSILSLCKIAHQMWCDSAKKQDNRKNSWGGGWRWQRGGGRGLGNPITAIFEKGVGDGVGRSKCVIFSKCVIWDTGLRSFLFSRKVMFCTQNIWSFLFLTITWFTKPVTTWWVFVHETGCIFEWIFEPQPTNSPNMANW